MRFCPGLSNLADKRRISESNPATIGGPTRCGGPASGGSAVTGPRFLRIGAEFRATSQPVRARNRGASRSASGVSGRWRMSAAAISISLPPRIFAVVTPMPNSAATSPFKRPRTTQHDPPLLANRSRITVMSSGQRYIGKLTNPLCAPIFPLKLAMITSDPARTRNTISIPNASARTLLVLSGPVVM
jgi:hypothetical protein